MSGSNRSILTQTINFKDGGTDYYLNDPSSIRHGYPTHPKYYLKVDSIDGFYGEDIESESHTIPHAIGERSGDSYRRGKGMSMNGTIFAPGLADFADAVAALQQCFWTLTGRNMTWNMGDGTSVYLTCRIVNALSINEVYTDYDIRVPWTVGLRADDPRPRKTSDNTLYYSWMT